MCHPKPKSRRTARRAGKSLPTVSRPNQTGLYPGQGQRRRRPPRMSPLPVGWTVLDVISWPYRLADHQTTCRWRRFCVWAGAEVS